jgi:hypothetical protein
VRLGNTLTRTKNLEVARGMNQKENRVGQSNHDQYKVAKGPKAKESGYEVSYEYTTGNETGNKQKNER